MTAIPSSVRPYASDQDTSIFHPDHYGYVTMLDAANGLRGANFFMFVERDDWHYSPVTAIGKPRPNLLAPYDSILGAFRALGPDRLLADVALVWSIEQHQTHLATSFEDWTVLSSIWWQDDQPKEDPRWWSTLRALVDSDADFEFVDARSEDAWPEVVIYAGAPSVPRAVFDRLFHHPATVIVSGSWPETDLGGDPLPNHAELRARAVPCEPGRLPEAMIARGATSYARADRDGCLTSVFVGAERTALFVCNLSGWSLPVTVRLEPGLADGLNAAPLLHTTRADGRLPGTADRSGLTVALTAHHCELFVWSSSPPPREEITA